ncbi:hypothetical protein Plhal304r1_c031g0101101 [Plasmopara halstedii]
MRVYVLVAIFISGVSFCFAIRLRAKACNDTDSNGRDLLCTRVHKADSISDGAQSHNVERVENEAHFVNKENEARMQDGALDSMLEKLMLEWPELPINAMDRVDELIHDISAVKTPRQESSPAYQFAQHQPIDAASHSPAYQFAPPQLIHAASHSPAYQLAQPQPIHAASHLPAYPIDAASHSPAYQFAQPQPIHAASHFNHPGDTVGSSIIAGLEASYYKSTTPLDWLRRVNFYRSIALMDNSIEKYDNTRLLAFLARKVKPQGVVNLFGNLANIPDCVSFAEDVQRTIVLDSTYKHLVFGRWIIDGYHPEKILDIFFAHKPVVIKVTDQLFLAWLEYCTLYWKGTNSKSPLRYAEFLKALRKYLSEENLNKMISSREFKEAFLKVDGVQDDLKNIRWTRLSDYSLSKKDRPDRVFSKIIRYSPDLDDPENSLWLWMLNYVVQYRKQSTFTNIELFIMLTSELSFESLMKLLRSQWKYPQLKKLADDMLKSMFSSITMLTTLAKSGVKPEEYFHHLVSVYNTVDMSSEPVIVEIPQQNERFHVALQYLKYALVVDLEINNMKFDDSIETSIDFLSGKMHDLSDQRSRDFLRYNMKQFRQNSIETEHGLPPVS